MRNIKNLICGFMAGVMIVMSYVAVIVSSFVFSASFLKASEVTGFIKDAIIKAEPAQSQNLYLAQAAVHSFYFVLSLWKYFLAFGILGAIAVRIKEIDDTYDFFSPLSLFSISRTFMYWFAVSVISCYLFALLKLREIIVFDSIFSQNVHLYSFWLLSIGYIGGSFAAAMIIKSMWLFWYRLFTGEKYVEEPPDFDAHNPTI